MSISTLGSWTSELIHNGRINQRAFRAHFDWWSSQDLLKLVGNNISMVNSSIEDEDARDQQIAALFAEGVPDSESECHSEDESD